MKKIPYKKIFFNLLTIIFITTVNADDKMNLGLEIYNDRMHCIPHAADDLARAAQKNLKIIDKLIRNQMWVCGDWFSLSDIILFCALDFGEEVGQPIDTTLLNLNVWFSTMMTRDSVHESRE